MFNYLKKAGSTAASTLVKTITRIFPVGATSALNIGGGFKATDIYKAVNTGAGTVRLNAEDGTAIAFVVGGDVLELMALIDSPATSTDWKVLGQNKDYILVNHIAYGSTLTKIGTFSGTQFDAQKSIAYARDTVNGDTFTAVQSGMYSVTRTFVATSNATWGVTLNSTHLTTDIQSLDPPEVVIYNLYIFSGGAFPATSSWTGWLNAGDIIRAHDESGITDGTNKGSMYIARLDS